MRLLMSEQVFPVGETLLFVTCFVRTTIFSVVATDVLAAGL